MSNSLKLTVLGSGTSVGVPTIGCSCDVCQSKDPRDNRLRPSVWVQFAGRSVLIDTGPDFRVQALRAAIPRVDAILFTHAHADHIMGLDDVRPFNFRQRGPIPIYGSAETLADIQRVFQYIFVNVHAESSVPKLASNTVDGAAFDLFGLPCTPIRLVHGKGEVYGYRIGGLAYLTDHSEIPEESIAKLRDLDVLFLDALRHKPHPTHSTVDRSLAYVEQLAPKRAFFTHIGHDLPHERTEQLLPPGVRLAYDGMEIEVEVDVASREPAPA
ncbi:MAG: MBL fold metallo-hydrolase [Bryobacteraceae bacterium]